MGKLFLSLAVFIFLFGCSNENIKKDENNVSRNDIITENLSLEEQILELMAQNNFLVEEIIHIEIKDDFIFVISQNAKNELKEAIIKNNQGKLEWVKGSGRATYFSAQDSPCLVINLSTDYDMKNVDQVKYFGNLAKEVTYFKKITNDFTQKIKFWVAVTDAPPTGSDIEYIEQK